MDEADSKPKINFQLQKLKVSDSRQKSKRFLKLQNNFYILEVAIIYILKFKKESKDVSLSGDIRAVLSQINYARSILRHSPNLDEIVDYGIPFELKYSGRREDIEGILKVAEEKGYVKINEKGQYIESKKGGNLSSLGYIKEE